MQSLILKNIILINKYYIAKYKYDVIFIQFGTTSTFQKVEQNLPFTKVKPKEPIFGTTSTFQKVEQNI